MTNNPTLACRKDPRRATVRTTQERYGLDSLEVSPDQLTLHITFLGKGPAGLKPENLRIDGGQRIQGIRFTGVTFFNRAMEPGTTHVPRFSVHKAGDFSVHTFRVVAADDRGRPTGQPMPGFDTRYDHIDFQFKAGCPSNLDCKPQAICPPPVRVEPEINYLAKDYSSFRQLILDLLAYL